MHMLRLEPVVASSRALFAAATVLVCAQGHASVGNSHLDLPSVVLAFFVLLFVSWRTNNPRTLFVAALAAQGLVHLRGAPISGDAPIGMFAVHGAGAMVAWLLLWHFEAVWGTVTAALTCAMHVLFGDRQAQTTIVTMPALVGRRSGALPVFVSVLSRRGPPVLA